MNTQTINTQILTVRSSHNPRFHSLFTVAITALAFLVMAFGAMQAHAQGLVEKPCRRSIHSAAGYTANIESAQAFAVAANAAKHCADVTDPDGNTLFGVAQNGDIVTADGYTLTTKGAVYAGKGQPVVQLDPSFGIYRTAGGYELGYDAEQGARTVTTPAGQTFRIENNPRQLFPSGLYYD